MGQFSFTHLLLLAVIFLLFFGPSRLPQLGQSLGRAIRGFKEGLNGQSDDSETRSVGSNQTREQLDNQHSTQMTQEQSKDKSRDPHRG